MSESVLFVDQRNTCLSAVAEFAFRKATGFRVPVSSAGISPADGYLEWRVRELLRDEGFGFELFLSFRSKKVSRQLLDAYDIVIAFNNSDLARLRGKFPSHAHKIFLATEYAGEAGEIPDPCGEPAGSEGRCKESFERLLALSNKIRGRL